MAGGDGDQKLGMKPDLASSPSTKSLLSSVTMQTFLGQQARNKKELHPKTVRACLTEKKTQPRFLPSSPFYRHSSNSRAVVLAKG